MSTALLISAAWAAFWTGPAYAAFTDAWTANRDLTPKVLVQLSMWLSLFVGAVALAFLAGRAS